MRRARAAAAVGLLLLGLAGCSGYRQAALPGPDPSAASADDRPVLTAGMPAHLRLGDGRRLDGTVTAVGDSTLTLVRPGNYGPDVQVIPYADVARVDVAVASKVESAAAYGVGTTAIVFAALLAVAALFIRFPANY